MSLYRIWFSDSNNRSELGRATAKDIDEVIEYVKTEYLKPGTQLNDIDYQGDDQAYLMIDTCKDCERGITTHNPYDGEKEFCENCEISEYIEIIADPDTEPEYTTIFGTNEYADLTKCNPYKAEPWSPQIAEAWTQSPEKGISALILQTVKDNPELKPGFSKDLLEKSRDTLDQ